MGFYPSNIIMLYFLGPSPPLDIMVVEQDIAFASVRWTAPNDPNKDSYTYHVKLYLNGYWMNYRIVYSTEVNFTHLAPGRNYTLTVNSSCNNKSSQPATITFTAGNVQFNPLHKIFEIDSIVTSTIHFFIHSCVLPRNVLSQG